MNSGIQVLLGYKALEGYLKRCMLTKLTLSNDAVINISAGSPTERAGIGVKWF
jgi:hypothetical protein